MVASDHLVAASGRHPLDLRAVGQSPPQSDSYSPAAAKMLETLSSTNWYTLIYPVNSVKGAATRVNNAQLVQMLERGETPFRKEGRDH